MLPIVKLSAAHKQSELHLKEAKLKNGVPTNRKIMDVMIMIIVGNWHCLFQRGNAAFKGTGIYGRGIYGRGIYGRGLIYQALYRHSSLGFDESNPYGFYPWRATFYARFASQRLLNAVQMSFYALHRLFSTLQRLFSAMQRSYSAMQRSYSTLQRLYSTLQRSYSTLQRLRSAMQRLYSTLQRSYSALQTACSAMQRSCRAIHLPLIGVNRFNGWTFI
jgi:hypothetical protein